jgi:transcription termination factor NusB
LRLSRKFSTTEAASFVNAILDHLYQKENGEINEEKGIGS